MGVNVMDGAGLVGIADGSDVGVEEGGVVGVGDGGVVGTAVG